MLTKAAPGKKQFVNISLARSAIDANKSFRGAISYPYTTVMIVDAVNLIRDDGYALEDPNSRRVYGNGLTCEGGLPCRRVRAQCS